MPERIPFADITNTINSFRDEDLSSGSEMESPQIILSGRELQRVCDQEEKYNLDCNITGWLMIDNIIGVQKQYISQIKSHQGWDKNRRVFLTKYSHAIMSEKDDEDGGIEKRRCYPEVAEIILEYVYECYNYEVLRARIKIHKLVINHLRAYERLITAPSISNKKFKRFQVTLRKVKRLGTGNTDMDREYLFSPTRYKLSSYFSFQCVPVEGVRWTIDEEGNLLIPFGGIRSGRIAYARVEGNIMSGSNIYGSMWLNANNRWSLPYIDTLENSD